MKIYYLYNQVRNKESMSLIVELSDGKELLFNPTIRTMSTVLSATKPGERIKLAAIPDLTIWFIFEYHNLRAIPPKSAERIKQQTFIDVFGHEFGNLLNRYCYQPSLNEEHLKEFGNMDQRNYASLIRLKQFHKDAEYLGMKHLTDLLIDAIAIIIMRAPSPEKLTVMLSGCQV